jgi:integrase
MLNLYRRHRADGKNKVCDGGHKVDSISYEADENRRKAKGCRCPIYASGTLNESFKRRNLKTFDWREAKLRAAVFETAKSWDQELVRIEVAPPAPLKDEPKEGALIADALAQWVKEYEHAVDVGEKAAHTARNVRAFAKKLNRWSEEQGYRRITQLGVGELREFRRSWVLEGTRAIKLRKQDADVVMPPVGRTTRRRLMQQANAFFGFCLSSEWIDSNPMSLLKEKRRSGVDIRDEQKFPFAEAEMDRMLAACEQYQPSGKEDCTGRDLADFIDVAVSTGLRISDLVQLRRNHIAGDRLDLRAMKNKRRIQMRLEPETLLIVERRTTPDQPYVFGFPLASVDTLTARWRTRLNRLWRACGEWEHRPTPHRFRHTFARRLLEVGTHPADVAQLLGDEEGTIRKCYSAWVVERQDRLDRVLDQQRQIFRERRKLHIVDRAG